MFQPLAITLLLCAISLGPGLSTCVAAPLLGRIVQSLNAIMQAEITDGHVAGAVVLIGDADGVLYRHAVGERVIGPHPQPMTAETVFDLASLTKPVATTTAILQLAERGRLSLDAPVSAYWPAFGQHGKQGITVRALLTHTSGLPAGVSSRHAFRDKASVLQDLVSSTPIFPPGLQVHYSDLNFIALGEIVSRVTGKPLDVWCTSEIFKPLGMQRTGFHPDTSDIAPTSQRGGSPTAGIVNDPIAAAMGGVAGNAGLFSTADDLALFARMLLREGKAPGTDTRILTHRSVALEYTPATLNAAGPLRSTGWSIEAPFIANRYRSPPAGAIAHLGYTGTGLWLDLVTRRFVIILTSRLYAGPNGDASSLRTNVLGAVASDAAPMTASEIARAAPAMTAAIEYQMRLPTSRGPVLSGIDVIESTAFSPISGRRIALITNRSGVDSKGKRTIDVLAHAQGITLVRVFAPEHGLNVDMETRYGDTVDAPTGLPVRSLYAGEWGIPNAELTDVDALVFDIQDVGVRFFTYLAILGQALESAASAHIPLVVLDRPNPLDAQRASGPVSDAAPPTLTGYHPLALAHGMTVAELAQMFNAERAIGAALTVVRMAQYERRMSFSDTGLGWVPPSPNLRDVQALAWYPDAGLIEGAAISVGRGTPTPFALVGAPWLHPDVLAQLLAQRFPAVTYVPTRFVPTEGPFAGELCSGVRLVETAIARRPGQLGIVLAQVLLSIDPKAFRVEALRASIGSDATWQALKDGKSQAEIFSAVEMQVASFELRRSAYLLY
ncbi:MAG: serine hydrolase [Cupriavidus sp.]|jgi:uncharacterized protein YbbC (DUF1343 family)|uniref:serine hydrolase n=1 Tax=Cupriavidus TaxID=106589 RepID=UPI000C45F74C|nr:serine hydrolase [Cupriavidus sp.]